MIIWLIFITLIFVILFYPLPLVLPDILHDFIPEILKKQSILVYIQSNNFQEVFFLFSLIAGVFLLFMLARKPQNWSI